MTELILLLNIIVSNDSISYKKDITPIFKKHCAECHSASSWPDKNWMNYEIAKNNSQKIKLRSVDQKNMPPGNFTGMSDVEREVIKRWVDGGTLP